MAKVTKQRAAFDSFARTMLKCTLVNKLEEGSGPLAPDMVAKIDQVIEAADVSVLSQTAEEEMLKRVDFKTFQKVEKLLSSDEVKDTLVAAQEVGAAVQVEIYAVLNELFGGDQA